MRPPAPFHYEAQPAAQPQVFLRPNKRPKPGVRKAWTANGQSAQPVPALATFCWTKF